MSLEPHQVPLRQRRPRLAIGEQIHDRDQIPVPKVTQDLPAEGPVDLQEPVRHLGPVLHRQVPPHVAQVNRR